MSVRLRLQRHGASKTPYFRVVAADQRSPRDGRFIEMLGTYDPVPDPPEIRLDQQRIDYWLNVGAQPSYTVRSLIRKMKRGEPVIDLSEEGADAAARAKRAAERKKAREKARKKAAQKAKKAKDDSDDEAAEAKDDSDDEAVDAKDDSDDEAVDAKDDSETTSEDSGDAEETSEDSGDVEASSDDTDGED